MHSAESYTVKLLSANYKIKCTAAEKEKLSAAAATLNQQLVEIKKKYRNLDETQLFMLAALNLSHELLACQRQQAEHRRALNQLLLSLDQQAEAESVLVEMAEA